MSHGCIIRICSIWGRMYVRTWACRDAHVMKVCVNAYSHVCVRSCVFEMNVSVCETKHVCTFTSFSTDFPCHFFSVLVLVLINDCGRVHVCLSCTHMHVAVHIHIHTSHLIQASLCKHGLDTALEALDQSPSPCIHILSLCLAHSFGRRGWRLTRSNWFDIKTAEIWGRLLRVTLRVFFFKFWSFLLWMCFVLDVFVRICCWSSGDIYECVWVDFAEFFLHQGLWWMNQQLVHVDVCMHAHANVCTHWCMRSCEQIRSADLYITLTKVYIHIRRHVHIHIHAYVTPQVSKAPSPAICPTHTIKINIHTYTYIHIRTHVTQTHTQSCKLRLWPVQHIEQIFCDAQKHLGIVWLDTLDERLEEALDGGLTQL